MKEGHNLSYVTKMGAYGLAVAAAFAVALAVLLSALLDPDGRGADDADADGFARHSHRRMAARVDVPAVPNRGDVILTISPDRLNDATAWSYKILNPSGFTCVEVTNGSPRRHHHGR